MDRPLAYHITFGTFGTRLHGDPRGTVDRKHNQPGEPIVGRDADWERLEQGMLQFAPVRLTVEQRCALEQELPAVCRRGGWTYHLAAAQEDHVHVLVTAAAEGKAVRRWMKVWLGEMLSCRWPRAVAIPGVPGATWWAEGGSVKWVWDEAYFHAVGQYIAKQRTTQD